MSTPAADTVPTTVQTPTLGAMPPTLTSLGHGGSAERMAKNLQAAADAPAQPAPEPTPEPTPEPVVTKEPEKRSLLSEPTPTPEPVKPEGKKTSKDWNEVKRLREEAEARAEAAEKKAASLEPLAKEREELLPLKEQVAQLKAKNRALSLEYGDDTFREEFVDGRNNLISDIKKLAEGLSVEPDLMDKLLTADPIARLKIMKEFGMDTMDAIALREAFGAVDALDKRKAAEVKRWSENESIHSFSETKLLREQEQQRADIGKAFDAILPRIAERFPQFRENGDPSKNSQVQEDIAFARQLATGEASQEDMAAAPYLAVAARRLGIENSGLREENKKLKAAVADLTKGTPGVGGGDAADDRHPDDGKPVGANEYFKNRWK